MLYIRIKENFKVLFFVWKFNIYELYFKNMKFIVALGVEICIIKLFDFLNLKFSIVTWRFIWTLEKN